MKEFRTIYESKLGPRLQRIFEGPRLTGDFDDVIELEIEPSIDFSDELTDKLFGTTPEGDYMRHTIPVTVEYDYYNARFEDEQTGIEGYDVIDNDTGESLLDILPNSTLRWIEDSIHEDAVER